MFAETAPEASNRAHDMKPNHGFDRLALANDHLCSSVVQIFLAAVDGKKRNEPRMNTDEASLLHELSERIIGCAFTLSNTLGVGFLEKVYENALAHELRRGGLTVVQQHAVTVHYDGVVVGTYAADLLVEGAILVELKAVKALDAIHTPNV